MTIEITNLEFQTIIGLLDFERTTPQKVRVDCTLSYTYRHANKILTKKFLNYADVVEHIERELHKHRFELIEEALLSLRKSLKKEFPTINELWLRIMKPDILDNCEVALTLTHKF